VDGGGLLTDGRQFLVVFNGLRLLKKK